MDTFAIELTAYSLCVHSYSGECFRISYYYSYYTSICILNIRNIFVESCQEKSHLTFSFSYNGQEIEQTCSTTKDSQLIPELSLNNASLHTYYFSVVYFSMHTSVTEL